MGGDRIGKKYDPSYDIPADPVLSGTLNYYCIFPESNKPIHLHCNIPIGRSFLVTAFSASFGFALGTLNLHYISVFNG